MPVIGGNPENLRDDLQAQAYADNAASLEAALVAASEEPEPFDPVDVVRQMRGEPSKATAKVRQIAEDIRRQYGAW